MRSLFPTLFGLVLVSVACVSGCSDERHSRGHGYDDDGDDDGATASCAHGVSIALGDVRDRFGDSFPISVKACFDLDCDDMTLLGPAPKITWKGAPGGPPTQLTSPVIRESGDVHIEILRIDDADYSDGVRHTAAVSIEDRDGKLLFSKAASISVAGCTLTPVDATDQR